LPNEFRIAEIDSFVKKVLSRKYKSLYEKISDFVYPQLRLNPFFGPNIKKLQGEFKDFYRYRIGDYRLFYMINQKEIIVFVVDLISRKDAYKKKK